MPSVVLAWCRNRLSRRVTGDVRGRSRALGRQTLGGRLRGFPSVHRWSRPEAGALTLALALVLAACGGGDAMPTVAPATPTAAVRAEPSPTPTVVRELAWEDVVEQLRPSTVMIVAYFPETAVSYEGIGFGTGILYSDEGYIVTNAHVVEGAASLSVVAPGSTRERPARFVGVSPCDDLAVIQVDGLSDLAPATFGSSSELRVGEEVVALGYPFGAEIGTDITVTRGVVSKLDVQFPPYQSLIQTDTPINPGDSGGPLVNRRGEVIGITSLGVDPSVAEALNFAISIDEAKPLISELERGRNRHWLGMNLVPNTYEDYFGTGDGLVVAAVASRSPASAAGVQPAYLLTTLEGVSVSSLADVCRILRSHKDGDGLRAQFLNVTDTEVQVLEGELVIGEPTASAPLKVVARQPFAAGEPTTPPSSGVVTSGAWEFASADGDWFTGELEDSVIEVRDGAYHIVFKEGGWYRVIAPESIAEGGDQAVIADVQVVEGLAGLAVRFSLDNAGGYSFYVCFVTVHGEYGCGAFVDSEYVPLIDPTPSEVVSPGGVNELLLAVVGTRITFEVNGTEVASFEDTMLTYGVPGVYAEGYLEIPGEAWFDNVAMEVVP